VLPNLLVIGAGKAGTTSLHHYLGLHPEIAMSRVKELHFFLEEPTPSRLRWYAAQFPDDAPVRGESSPTYTQRHRYEGVPPLIAQNLPDARLVYVVRDPVERFLSAYRFNRYDLRATDETLEEYFEDGRAIPSSHYAYQLEPYFELFPRERILVVEHRDLASRGTETLQSVFGFLGVDDSFESGEFDRRLNRTGSELHANALGRTALRALERSVGRRRAMALRARLPRSAIRPLLREHAAPSVEPSPELRARIEEAMRPDAERFRALTGMAFADWSV
jgi:Sulfotransferase domain